jgi:hypothetical protein
VPSPFLIDSAIATTIAGADEDGLLRRPSIEATQYLPRQGTRDWFFRASGGRSTSPAHHVRCGHTSQAPGDCLWDSWLEIEDETLRLIWPSCDRRPRLERLKAVVVGIAAYALRKI